MNLFRDIFIKISLIAVALLVTSVCAGAESTNPAFDRIRPVAASGMEALEQGDSLKAMTLLTEALIRGQEWPQTQEELSLMANIVEKVIPLRARLKGENLQRLMLEIMIGAGMETVSRKANTFGGSPEKLPQLHSQTPDSITPALRKAIDLMVADSLKECEKLLLTLYTDTWTRGLHPERKHEVANKLGLLYVILKTPEQAIDILRKNKIDMDQSMDPNLDYAETLFYLSLAKRDVDTRIIHKCYLETANEIAKQQNLDVTPINDDFKRIFENERKDTTAIDAIKAFIRSNDKNLSFLTESQREKRWENLSGKWEVLKLSLIDSTGMVKDIDACLNAFQYEKQILLRSAAKTMEALLEAEDEEAISLTDSLLKTRQELTKCLSYQEKELTASYERIQKELLHHHTMNSFEGHLYHILTTEEVAGRLRGNETFIDFGTLETDEGERYFAILISPRTPKGRIIPLCTVRELEDFIRDTQKEDARLTAEHRYGGDFLYDKIWKPLKTGGYLNEIVYYCPAGMLGLIMPDAIRHDGRYAAEDFEFHILSSAEAIADAHAGDRYTPEKLYSFCAIDYYCERTALIANARMYGSDREIYPGNLDKDTDMRTLYSLDASILPLHAPEDFDWLESLCAGHDVPAMNVTGFNASEHALKFLSGRDAGTLNIVTHAFSMPKTLRPSEMPYFTSLSMKTRFDDDMEIEILPLYRTGIMLSGAERAWCSRNKISGIEDGVVNGEELASLDLHGVDLLTLIACDTGNGDIDPQEGILGLRRALKLAGCGTLVTTAWNLDKEAADAYLQEFYTSLLAGSGIHRAHREAQMELLKRFDHPYYWAVFQLID